MRIITDEKWLALMDGALVDNAEAREIMYSCPEIRRTDRDNLKHVLIQDIAECNKKIGIAERMGDARMLELFTQVLQNNQRLWKILDEED